MRALLLAACLLTAFAGPARAGQERDATLEDNVKTAFIYKFTRYVEWPAAPAGEDFVIGVLGDSGVLAPLRELAREKLVNGARIKVERLSGPGEIGRCRVLFVSRSEAGRLEEIVKAVGQRRVLTVGEGPGFASRGLAINFVIDDGKLRFEINRKAAARAGLEISSQLLKLAILVEEGAYEKH